MIYDPKDKKELKAFFAEVDKLVMSENLIELKEIKKTRTALLNRALHLFFRIISDNLNEIGQTFHYTGLKGMDLETRFTPELVKEVIWRPLQIALYKKISTTEVDSLEINEIIDTIILYFAEKGITIEFPHDNFKNIEDEKDVK